LCTNNLIINNRLCRPHHGGGGGAFAPWADVERTRCGGASQNVRLDLRIGDVELDAAIAMPLTAGNNGTMKPPRYGKSDSHSARHKLLLGKEIGKDAF